MSYPLTYLNSILSDIIKISGDNTNIIGQLTVNDSGVIISGQNISFLVNDAGYLTEHPDLPSPTVSTPPTPTVPLSSGSVVSYVDNITFDDNGHISGIEYGTHMIGAAGEGSSSGILAGSGISLSYDTENNNITINSSYSVNRGFININDNSTTGLVINGGYNVGALDLFLNGVKLVYNTDYTANDGSNAYLVDYATSGDIIEYISLFPSLAQNQLNTKGLSYYLS